MSRTITRDDLVSRLLDTSDARLLTLLRIAVGLAMLPHGAQKLFGWFGGYGFAGTMGYFTGTLHMPAALAFVAIVAESLGALALIAGFGARVAALGVIANMIGAVLLVHLPNGFFMNWFGAQAGEGFEYHLLVVTMAAPIALLGAGAWSVDRWLARFVRAPALAHA